MRHRPATRRIASTLPQAALQTLGAANDAGDDFAEAVRAGLASAQKSIPSRFLYDSRGSELFEAITALPEYYPTRTEIAILTAAAPDLAALLPREAVVVEYGAGSMRKTPLLLGALQAPRAYVPVDVAPEMLERSAAALQSRFPELGVRPLIGDFEAPLALPGDLPKGARIGFFPGSTIGNLDHDRAAAFLRRARATLHAESGGVEDWLVIGVDLTKPLSVLLPAYDDAAGVTAAFNRNVLHRINRDLGGTLDPAQFRHEARWNASFSRVEMHLVAEVAMRAEVAGMAVDFLAGESIHTENCHKFTVPEFQALAESTGWESRLVLCDAARLFSVHLLRARR